jgi:5-methylcytosine-specific restriction endonuclease McrA
VERIDIFVLAERDNFVCHICSGFVDMSVSRVSRFGATVDHVVPISKGGLDSLENVRLAHWICNIRKSDSLEFVNG